MSVPLFSFCQSCNVINFSLRFSFLRYDPSVWFFLFDNIISFFFSHFKLLAKKNKKIYAGVKKLYKAGKIWYTFRAEGRKKGAFARFFLSAGPRTISKKIMRRRYARAESPRVQKGSEPIAPQPPLLLCGRFRSLCPPRAWEGRKPQKPLLSQETCRCVAVTSLRRAKGDGARKTKGLSVPFFSARSFSVSVRGKGAFFVGFVFPKNFLRRSFIPCNSLQNASF